MKLLSKCKITTSRLRSCPLEVVGSAPFKTTVTCLVSLCYYREEDLLDLAPFLAENSRLGEYVYCGVCEIINFLGWVISCTSFLYCVMHVENHVQFGQCHVFQHIFSFSLRLPDHFDKGDGWNWTCSSQSHQKLLCRWSCTTTTLMRLLPPAACLLFLVCCFLFVVSSNQSRIAMQDYILFGIKSQLA